MMKTCPLPMLAVLAALAAGPGLYAADKPEAAGAADEAKTPLVLSSEAMQLKFVREGGRVRLGQLENKLSGRTITVAADDFRLEIEGGAPLQTADFRFVRTVREGRQLRLQFDNAGAGLGLEIVYELGEHDFFVRRWLELTTARPLPLRNVEVWQAGVPGVCPLQEEGPPIYLTENVWKIDGRKGFGLPVFLEDTFWGLESPTGYNRYEDGAVKLWQHPGRTVEKRFVSKTAVFGVARPQQVARQFRRYVETIQATPSGRLEVGFNTWYSLRPPTEKSCLEIAELFRRKLYEPYGVGIDAFILDDGWDKKDSLWEIQAANFPRGFGPVAEALKPMDTRLGLWMSISSGYSHAAWCARNGYAANANYAGFICQSDPKYRRDFAALVRDYQQRFGLGYFKLDSFMLTCDTDKHPWHLPGDFACEANAEAAEELFAAMRAPDHPVFLNPTCGMWCSPWWLRTVDSLWPDLYDGESPAAAPAPDFAESSITSRDAQLRRRCQQNPWFPLQAMDTLDISREGAVPSHNLIMATLARGQRFVNLLTDVRRFSDDDWRFLAAAIQWGRANAGTLSCTELLPGDPMAGEAYGYAHFRDGRGILSLRNPSLQPRTLHIKLDDASGWWRDEAKGTLAAHIIYPRRETLPGTLKHGDTLDIGLQGFEQMVVQLEPAGVVPPDLGLGRESRRESLPVKLSGTFPHYQATVAGTGRSTFVLLCRADTDLTGALNGTVTVNGKPAAVRAFGPQHNPPHKLFYREFSRQYWKWLQFDVPAGDAAIDIVLAPEASRAATLSGWLWKTPEPAK